MKADDIQINHLYYPCGISGKNIRITWKAKEGIWQRAYRVRIIDKNENILEDSQKINTSDMHYSLKRELPSKTSFICKVTLWDERDKEGETSESQFETGIERNQWKAKWINPEIWDNEEENQERKRASYLRRDFKIEKLGEARLYITAHGILRIFLNGKEVTENQLLPGNCQVDKRLLVETVPITRFLQLGENRLDVILGDGWYRGAMGHDQNLNSFGTDVALLCQLEIDGTVIMVSDEEFMASQNGPLGKNDFMQGEEYDARLEKITDYHSIKVEDFGYENLICRDTVPMRRRENFQAKMFCTPAGETVLDFGQNFAGYVEFDLVASEGDRILLTHGETLDADGNFTIDNFQNPKHPMKAQVDYICKEGRNRYHPSMCYFGFRYVKVETNLQITGQEFTGVAVYSDLRQTGWFTCGNPLVNQLFSNALWSMKSNFVDVPTDCPTREKSGFSGDCQIFIHTAMYLMDCYPVYAKWIREQAVSQYEDGCLKQVAPFGGDKGFSDGCVGWCDSIEIVPYLLDRRYHDLSLAREVYPAMKKWMLFELNKAKETKECNKSKLPEKLWPYLLDQGFLWGEWVEPGFEIVSYMREVLATGEPEIGTAYLYYGCQILSKLAGKLGREEDKRFFKEKAKLAKEAYRTVFVKEGKIEADRQCRYVRPMALGLLTPKEKIENAKRLAVNIQRNNGKLNTGFLTTHELCRVLSENGKEKAAYDLLLNEDMPGWLYSVKQGATTIPESWEGYGADGSRNSSFNHYAFGAVVGWLFDCVCGIRIDHKDIVIHPHPDKRLGYAKAVYDSPLGKIVSAWKYEDEQILYEVQIPENTKATILLANGKHQVNAGQYKFTQKL